MNQLIKILLYVLCITIILSCSNETESSKEPAPLRTVRSILISAPENGVTRTFSGTAKADLQSNLSFRVSGTIESLDIKVGDRLKVDQQIEEEAGAVNHSMEALIQFENTMHIIVVTAAFW